MSTTQWYYVDSDKNERIGPVDKADIEGLIQSGKLNENSYVWKKGLENWALIKDMEELSSLSVDQDQPAGLQPPVENSLSSIPEGREVGAHTTHEEVENFNWKKHDKDKRTIHIRVGRDRGEQVSAEYGPFSINELVMLYRENRISGETLFFAPEMSNWQFVADVKDFEELFSASRPQVKEEARRQFIRKPFVARMFFHDDSRLFEGLCRDISTGGMQVLVSNSPLKAGDEISLNVHPENTDHHFVATGKVVRLLPGEQGFSFRFINLGPDATNAISAYLDSAQ